MQVTCLDYPICRLGSAQERGRGRELCGIQEWQDLPNAKHRHSDWAVSSLQ